MPRHDDITTARISDVVALLERTVRRASEVLRALERAGLLERALDAGCRP